MKRWTDEKGYLNVAAVIRDMVILLAGLIFILWINPFSSVPTGHRGVITEFGKIRGIEPEGLVIMWPWQKLTNFNVRSMTVNINNAEGSTADTQPVHVDLTVRYRVMPDKVAEVFEQYSHDGDLTSYVDTATQEVFKAVTAQYTAPSLISKRNAVSHDIYELLKVKLSQYGAQVINIDMRTFAFSKDYMAAINEKVTQEQRKLAEDNKLKTVEAQQQQKVVIAEADAASQRARADGQAYARLKLAQAEADSLRIQNQALAQNKDVLELRKIEVDRIKADKWNGQLPTNIYAGAPIPFLSIDK